jgi:hypothetical protein
MAQGVSPERVGFRFACVNASECFEIVGRKIEASLDGFAKVERVVADLHRVEHPRPYKSVLILIAEAQEQVFTALVLTRSDWSRALRTLAHRRAHSRTAKSSRGLKMAGLTQQRKTLQTASLTVAAGSSPSVTMERVLSRSQRSSKATRSSSRFLKYK